MWAAGEFASWRVVSGRLIAGLGGHQRISCRNRHAARNDRTPSGTSSSSISSRRPYFLSSCSSSRAVVVHLQRALPPSTTTEVVAVSSRRNPDGDFLPAALCAAPTTRPASTLANRKRRSRRANKAQQTVRPGRGVPRSSCISLIELTRHEEEGVAHGQVPIGQDLDEVHHLRQLRRQRHHAAWSHPGR